MTQGRRENERGAIAVFMMLILTVIMGFAAMGFDLSYVRLARFEMKNATDAAAHAAMNVLRATTDKTQTTDATNAAIGVAGQNTVLGNPVTLTTSDVKFGIWDYDASTFTAGAPPSNAVQITGRKSDPSAAAGTVNTTFGRTLGTLSANVQQVSTAAFRARSMMFEMDITGSFLTNSCAIDDAIAADLSFLTAMYNAGSPKDKIGLDVFVGSASNFTPLQNLPSNYNNAGVGIYPDWQGDGLSALTTAHTRGLGVCTKATILPTGNYTCGVNTQWPNQANLKAGIPMPSCWAADSHYSPPTSTTTVYGGTNIGAGIASGIATLTATAKTYEVRSIVVFTDGGPLCCEAAGGGAICPQTGPCCADVTSGSCTDHATGACACSQAVYDYGTQEADLAKAAGIDVYVLEFGNQANWIAYANTLPRGRGFALNTADKTQLAAQLQTIANAIPVALVK
jgi:Flp pilus assembly protein TadG